MNTIYITGNLITLATLDSVSTEDSIYVKENLYNRRQSFPFRFTAKSNQSILINLGTSRLVTALSILNHNLTNSATISIDHNNANAFPSASAPVTWHVLNVFKKLSITDTWFLISISDAGNAETLTIGELVLSTWTAFPRPFKYPIGREKEHFIFDNVTPYQQRWRSYKATQKRFSLDFDPCDDSRFLADVESMFDDLSGIYPFVFVPDDSKDDAWYMEAPTILGSRADFENGNAFSLNLIEQSRGIRTL